MWCYWFVLADAASLPAAGLVGAGGVRCLVAWAGNIGVILEEACKEHKAKKRGGHGGKISFFFGAVLDLSRKFHIPAS